MRSRITIQQLIIFCIFMLLFSFKGIAGAHVEEDNMPDSVAEMEYRILLEFKPDDLEVRYKLGMVLFRTGKLSEAAEEFAYILKKDPQNVDAYISLARVKTKLANYTKAISLYQGALSIDPYDIHIYYYFGQTLEIKGDPTGAEAVYKNGLALDIPPENKHALEERPLLEEALKKLRAKTAGQHVDK